MITDFIKGGSQVVIRSVTYDELDDRDRERIRKLTDVFVERQGIRRVTKRAIRNAMSRPEHTLVVAFDDHGEIVGMIALLEMNIFTARVGHVEEVVVHEDWRSRGIATSILEEVVRIARKKKMDYLKLNTNVKNPSNGLYRKLGFVRKDDNLYKLVL